MNQSNISDHLNVKSNYQETAMGVPADEIRSISPSLEANKDRSINQSIN